MCTKSINKVVYIFILYILCSGFRENVAYCTCRTYAILGHSCSQCALNQVVTRAVLLRPVTNCKQVTNCTVALPELHRAVKYLTLLCNTRACPKVRDLKKIRQLTTSDNILPPRNKFYLEDLCENFIVFEVKCHQFQHKYLILRFAIPVVP